MILYKVLKNGYTPPYLSESIVKGFLTLCKRFYFDDTAFDPQTGELTLSWHADETGCFTERVVFPGAPFDLSPAKRDVLKHLFFYALLAAGISYFKTRPTDEIQVPAGCLNTDEAAFFNTFYISGLGEFAIRNRLNLQNVIRFPVTADSRAPVSPYPLPASNRVLIPVGGGKDSCVTAELVKKMSFAPVLVSVGDPTAIRACAAAANLPRAVIRRTLDPRLKTLNESGNVLNGHIPITGVLAFYLWIYAVLTDTPFVAMSCENSSNDGNLCQGALTVNHQYSKSLAFETDFAALTKPLTPAFCYFSLLRPLSEAHIARLFSCYCSAYFDVFTSCNKAFRLDETKRLTHWCGECDKCRFVFLILAPFMKRAALIRTVGRNPLADSAQEDGYRALLGLAGHKPFECVGTAAECRFALRTLAEMPVWREDVLVRRLAPLLPPPDITEQTVFAADGAHRIPAPFRDVFRFFKE